MSDDINPEVYERIPSVLTTRKLEAAFDEFNAWMTRVKAEDQERGHCICANCFGDRQGAVKMGFPQRYCLERPRLLTDMGDGSRRI